MTRALLATLATLTVCWTWAASAQADAAQVTVVSPGGALQTLALDALAGSEDVVERPYRLHSGGGEIAQLVSGFSLARLLEASGADPYGFSYLEVQRPAGGAVLLSHDQALDPGAFADGPPVVYKTATGTAFLRPNAGPDDLNGDDSFEAPQGISIVLRKGTQLQVRAKASTTKVKVGQKVSFNATVEGAGAGEQLTYSWYFDDGSSASGSEATHSFTKRGSYDVVVGITTPGNDAGTSGVVTIQVGAPTAGGPDRKGGGGNRTADAPDHGAAEGPSTGSGGSVGTGTNSGEGSVGRAPMDTQRGRRPRVQRGMTDTPPAEPSRQPAVPGEEVEGELLSASGPLTQEVEKQQAAARTGNLDGDGGEGGISTAAAGLLVTLGLLGTGALIEAGGLARILPGRRRAA